MKHTRPSFIHIDLKIKDELGLSFNEYALMDSISRLSNQPDYKWCLISKTGLGKPFNLCQRSVFKKLLRLESLGLIEKNASGKIRATQKWYDCFLLDKDYAQSSYKENPKYAQSAEDYAQSSYPTMHKVHRKKTRSSQDSYAQSAYYNTLINNSNNNNNINLCDFESKIEPIPEQVTEQILSFYNELLNGYWRSTPKLTKLIKDRLKFFTPEQLFRAVTGVAGSDWHNGTDERGFKATPNFVFADDDRVQKFLNMPSKIDYDIYPEKLPKFADITNEYCQSLTNELQIPLSTIKKLKEQFCHRFKNESRSLRYRDLFEATVRFLLKKGKID